MKVSDFDYDLPTELIAQYPAPKREDARLMVLDRKTGKIEHAFFPSIVEYLREGDVLVLNETKVFPARLYGKRTDTGGKLEVFLLNEKEPNIWEALVRPGRRAREGLFILFGNGELKARIGKNTDTGGRIIEFFTENNERSVWDAISEIGEIPLPPYIKRPADQSDKERYQTVYARSIGSVAAPTAGLHFTKELLNRIENKGVRLAYVLLHVGIGTFRPVNVENVEEHKMHAEFWMLREPEAALINKTRQKGGRVIAVGTTTVRVLESAADADGKVKAGKGWTSLFIYPGYQFHAVDALITNFHLPRSTLLMLICAFAGKEFVINAYKEAVERKYRFFSYGDAMLII